MIKTGNHPDPAQRFGERVTVHPSGAMQVDGVTYTFLWAPGGHDIVADGTWAGYSDGNLQDAHATAREIHRARIAQAAADLEHGSDW